MKSKKLYIELLEKEVLSLRDRINQLETEIRNLPNPIRDAITKLNNNLEEQLFYGIGGVNKKEDSEI